ncbi:MAG: penicillin-binding protein 2 [Patescibacteria group bacterium]|nr:penicillin-binding protein 2 [Patescibacteria group bacterium]MDE2015444.1 penicillin-binding protein 2 [Patescibacteria group bacterium]MDE2226941.1 penicillin-binding protein 2 [Patescibacteria group bacterium]
MVPRFSILIGGFSLLYSLLLFNLYQVQLVKGGDYLARAQSEYLAQGSLQANRGMIYFTDKNGNHLPAALNKDFPIIYAVPKSVSDPQEAANMLAPILNEAADSLTATLSKPNDSYEVLVNKASDDEAQFVNALGLKGIYIDTEPGRFYPLGATASQALGYVGPSKDQINDQGHYGLEEFYNSELAGSAGNASGGKSVQAVSGQDLILTIDPNIQIQSEKILSDLIKNQSATGGSIIVEEPSTGKILAIASLPDFDPNNYSGASMADFINPVTQHVYEPGSVFKVVTMAAGIDTGKITPQTTYYDTGSLTINGRTITNYDLHTHGAYGKATMTNVIEHSINTGAVFAESKIGNSVFTDYLKNFGFSEVTGIDLPGEVSGNLRQLNPKARNISFATASYGQGVAVTPLELINSMAAIANGGNLMRPYLNSALSPKILRNVISENTAKQVTQMMISAVDKAEVTKINGFSVAGKTGTAFIPDFKNGGYTDNVIDSYVGFAPASDPKFIALIKIDTLPSTSLAAMSVVPAFRDLAQYILNYYGTPPDRISVSN